MKIVLALRNTTHFPYLAPVISELCRGGHQVSAVFDPRWNAQYSDDKVKSFASDHKNFSFIDGIRPTAGDKWHNRLAVSRELLSVASYVNRINNNDQSGFYLERWTGYLPDRYRRVVESPMGRTLVASKIFQAGLQAFERAVAPYGQITKWLEEIRPDVVVASPTNMRYSGELEYVKAAKKLGIPTVVQVLSWDNLTTKGLLHIKPDVLLAWNQTHFEEAVTIHNIEPESIAITGSPFFDKWLEDERLSLPRDQFCQRADINPDRPYALYLGSSQNISRDETWLIKRVAQVLRAHPNPIIKEMHLLVRPHPGNVQHMSKLDDEDGVTVWPKAGGIPDSEESQVDFYNSLRHCVATVGVNTTGMIDAVINDRPCVTVMTEEYDATQSSAVHFNQLLHADVLDVTRSPEEAADAIERILNGEDRTRDARRRFTLDFVRPRGIDKPAAEFAAQAIEMAVSGNNGAQINAEIKDAMASTN